MLKFYYSGAPNPTKAALFLEEAGIAVIGYGSNRGPIMEAVDRFAEAGVATRFLQLRTLWPFPEEEVQAFIKDPSPEESM